MPTPSDPQKKPAPSDKLPAAAGKPAPPAKPAAKPVPVAKPACKPPTAGAGKPAGDKAADDKKPADKAGDGKKPTAKKPSIKPSPVRAKEAAHSGGRRFGQVLTNIIR